MTGSAFAALLATWIAAILSPGPDLFQIIRVGAKDRAAGVACALGIMVGNALWIIGSLLGLSALVQAVPEVLSVLQTVGGAYLLYMGIGALRGGLAARSQRAVAVGGTETGELPSVPPARELTTAKALGIGIATNLSNPKALLFFGAVFAQFVRPGMGAGWMAAIAITLIVTGVLWFTGFAVAVRALAAPIQQYGWAIDIVTGVVFIAIALWMLVEGVQGLAGILI